MIGHGRDEDSTAVVQLVDHLIASAIAKTASDIHLEPCQDLLRVRYRIDGVLFDQPSMERSQALQIISRLKVLSRLNIAEKRIPQDGKFQVNHKSGMIDVRVSTFPSLYGETMVIRVLDRSHMMIALDTLGMHKSVYEHFNALMHKQQGFLLVAGPTGSGKTTTLYAALSRLNNQEKNIITLEDPVEYNLSGVTQGQIRPESGFTFAQGIRSMLRQDPDVVMIGEVRDKETARSAIEAALTGHMVLSTVHTNDAASTVMRLMDMGIEPFLLNAALSGVLCQRLARKLCTVCKLMRVPTDEEKIMLQKLNLSLDMVAAAKGCELCFKAGYKGRVGIFELLIMSNTIRSLIVQHPNVDAVQQQAGQEGMQSLLDDAKSKVKQGIISLQELARVVL